MFLNGVLLKTETTQKFIPSKTGFYQVIITTKGGCMSVVSDSFKYTVSGTNSIKSNQRKFGIYPNPADKELNIDMENETNFKVNIFNISGNRVLEFENQNKINVSYIASGLYIIQIQTNTHSYSQKFWINR